MTTPTNWPNPERPGVPMFPERDGFHIIGRLAWKWHAASELWDGVANPDEFGTFYYVGPCLTPTQISEMLAGEREKCAQEALHIGESWDGTKLSPCNTARQIAQAIRNLGDAP